MLKQFKEKWKRYQKRKTTIRELSALSDRELRDLGICRADIRTLI